jgi:polyferredoxin
MTNRTIARPRRTFDLMRMPGVGRFLSWRHARTVLGLPLLLIAALMVLDGLTGPQLAPKNLATVLTWVHYRGFLVLALLVAGNLFCMACPFMLPRNLARRFIQPTRTWPRRLRHKWIALSLFALVLFAYELFDLWATPWWTAWLIGAYFAVALIADSLFQGAAFCKYLCPLGQFNFVASLNSPLEVRVRDAQVCGDCHTKDCIKGRPEGTGSDPQSPALALRGCELWLFQERKLGNMDCTFCLDCVHACPHDNVGIPARLPASELLPDTWRSGIGRFSRRSDLAALVVLFTFGALLNAFGMVSPVYHVEAWLAERLGTGSEALVLGIIFSGGLVAAPVILLGLSAWLARRWTGLRVGLLSLATRYAYALAPLGFGVWIAHYAFHFLSGFWTFVPVIQGALADLRWSVLGTPRWELGPLLPSSWLLPLEQAVLALSWVISLLVAYRMAEEDAPGHLWQAFLPWAGLSLLLWLAANWLMGQPMEMRGTFLG